MKNLEAYQQMSQQIKDIREQMVRVAGAVLQEGVRRVFDEYPEVESISWAQYTPYFNDGDECVFGVGNDEPDINEECGEDIAWVQPPHQFAPAQKLAASILQSIEEEDYKVMFGDHVRVTIKRNGVAEIESHDHD